MSPNSARGALSDSLPAPDLEAGMDLRVARVIERNRRLRDVADVEAVERFSVELELAEVRGKEQQPARREPLQRRADEIDVVALHVEFAVHAFRVREGRGVEEDEVVRPATALREPGD